MNEEPKSIWRKSWTGWRGLVLWLVSLTLYVFFLMVATQWLLPGRTQFSELVRIAIMASLLVGVLAVLFVVAFIRAPCCGRNFKRFLFGAACFVTLVALFCAEENWRGKRAWKKFRQAWEAKGEHFDRASVLPPVVPDDRNFALTPVVASSYEMFLDQRGHRIEPTNTNVINRLQMSVGSSLPWPTNGDWRAVRTTDLSAWQTYYRDLAAKTNQFPVPAQPQSPAADVLLALSQYDPTIAELREASRLPESRFPLEYDKDDPAAMVLPHLAPMKGCAQVLQLRALAELRDGQSDGALADLKLLFRLIDSLRAEPILISHLVRIAMVNIALQPVWEGLAEHRWSDAQLAELHRELAGLDFLADYKLAMRGEMALFQGGIFEYLRHRPDMLASLAGGDGGKMFSLPMVRLMPRGWFYQNQLRSARAMVEFYLPAADVGQGILLPASIRQADAAVETEIRYAHPYNFINRLLLPALGNAAKQFAAGQNAVNLARTAGALERHRLAHGAYPESLDALAPSFIARLPHDVINGQPLHYNRAADGRFVLYSVGWNETDDGGELALTQSGSVDVNQGDWVWRYPQK